MKYLVQNETETEKVAKAFAKTLKKGDIVALYGTLGAGKTAFCRGLIRSLTGEVDEVPSPTFTLLQTYETKNFVIYHFDFYRLKNPDEAYEIGIEEAFYDGVSLIEWPEKLGNLLPVRHKRIDIKIINDLTREITIE